MPGTFDEFIEEVRGQTPEEFELLAKKIIEDTGLYRDINRDNSRLFDFVSYLEPGKPILIEVKSVRVLSDNVVHLVERRMTQWSNKNLPTKDPQILIILSGIASVAAQEAALDRKIEIWTLADLYALRQPGGNKKPYSPEHKSSRCHRILEEMENTASGAGKPALEYQKLSISLFRCLYSPDLDLIDEEVKDEDGRNRRDAIFDIRAHSGQWSLIRSLYAAPYVVVDAKNHKNPISKRSVIDISHYLKAHGCGLLGILLTREGGSGAAISATRDHWISQEKMIVILSHKDLEIAADLKNDGSDPVEIIKGKINDLRLSM